MYSNSVPMSTSSHFFKSFPSIRERSTFFKSTVDTNRWKTFEGGIGILSTKIRLLEHGDNLKKIIFQPESMPQQLQQQQQELRQQQQKLFSGGP
jgi:hypothetical protein